MKQAEAAVGTLVWIQINDKPIPGMIVELSTGNKAMRYVKRLDFKSIPRNRETLVTRSARQLTPLQLSTQADLVAAVGQEYFDTVGERLSTIKYWRTVRGFNYDTARRIIDKDVNS